MQFAAAIGFTICTFVLSAQARYLHDADRGFTREGLILVDSLSDLQLLKRQNGILDVLAAVPGVKAISVSDREPAATNISVTNLHRPGLPGPDPNLVMEKVGANYFKTYDINLIAGRVFDPSRQVDDTAGLNPAVHTANPKSVILNESGAKALAFASPHAAISQRLFFGANISLQVIGVVRDVRFMSPHQPVGPILYIYISRDIRNAVAAVRYEGVSAPEMTSRLAAAWRRVAPEVPFAAKTADARLSDYYVPDEQRARLFTLRRGAGCGHRVRRPLRPSGLQHRAADEGDRHSEDAGRLHRRHPAPAGRPVPAAGGARQPARLAPGLLRHCGTGCRASTSALASARSTSWRQRC